MDPLEFQACSDLRDPDADANNGDDNHDKD